MKRVFLIRHAKSSWADPGLSDFERPLNARGLSDAPEMAKRLVHQKLKIDAFLSSPARRAMKTAQLFAHAYDQGKKDIIQLQDLYLAGSDQILDAIRSAAPDKAETIAVVAHNPGITELANSLTDARIDNMPTASVFAVQAESGHWQDFPGAGLQFLFFDFPKNRH